jgi:hypothetical protein
MGRLTTILTTAGLAAAGALAVSGNASAAAYCPSHESFFGTIQRVNGNVLTVSTAAGRWATVRIDSGARINTNGDSLRPGAYVGAYGCVTPNGVFHASEVSLSANASSYNRTVSGVVDRIENGRLIVRENGRHYGAWYVPSTDDFSRGQSITGSGMLGRNGAFYPQTINGRSVSYDPDETSAPSNGGSRTITLTGVVQRIGSSSLLMWEPAQHHSGTWIVNGAGRYRVGERLVATGTEDRRGNFYPAQITAQ